VSGAAPMWRCPRCGRSFASVNQTHTCAALRSVDSHFAGADAEVRQVFDAIVAITTALGPFEILAEKTRIAFHVRMSFAAFTVRRHWLDGHVVLARKVSSPRFRRVEVYSPSNVLHAFRLSRPDEVDDEVRAWLAEAYAVGQQQHRRRP
jgi:Domain of unknown function (DUF5655)